MFGWAALVLWVGILLATLFPYDFRPHNDVKWTEAGSLQFGKHGVATIKGPLLADTPGDDSLCSVEVWLRPASFATFSTILGVSTKGHPSEFELKQDGDGLVVSHIWTGDTGRQRLSNRDVSHVFKLGQMTQVTLTSGPKGLTVYSDGQTLQNFPGYTLSRHALTGEWTLGTDPVRMDPWSGELCDMVVYGQELTPAQVTDHYQNRTRVGGPHCDDLCLRAVTIPAYFKLPFKPFLSPPWKEFAAHWVYFRDALWNVIGFVPFGFALCGYLFITGKARTAIWITVLAGGFTSLAIEILQGYLPQRASGITDVITNTCGALVGAYIVNWKPIRRYIDTSVYFA